MLRGWNTVGAVWRKVNADKRSKRSCGTSQQAVFINLGAQWVEGSGVMRRNDVYPISLMDFHCGWRRRANDLSESLKLFLLIGTFINNKYGSRFYGKATNILRRVRGAYDQALTRFDLLAPTMPMSPQPLPEAGYTREDDVRRAVEPAANTSPFNITHHPAMSLPCGMSEGLPAGLMLVGRHFDEAIIYRAAYAFERSIDWRTL